MQKVDKVGGSDDTNEVKVIKVNDIVGDKEAPKQEEEKKV